MEKQTHTRNNYIKSILLVSVFLTFIISTSCDSNKKPIVIENNNLKFSILEKKVFDEASRINDNVLKKQNEFYCFTCHPSKDTLVRYPNLLLDLNVVKNERYLYVEFYKVFRLSETIHNLYFDPLTKPETIFGIDRLIFLFDKKRLVWDYIGEKIGSGDELVNDGYHSFVTKRYRETLTKNDKSLADIYSIQNIEIKDISQYVEIERRNIMKKHKSNLSEFITEEFWWEE